MVQTDARSDLLNDRRAGGIYRTAVQMISEKGFAATSMNDIAEAVELTKPGLYYYVKGKQELLFSIMSFAMDRLDADVVEPARAIADPEERLRLIVRRHARLLTSEPAAASTVAILMDEMRGLEPARRAEIEGRKRAYFELLRQTLDELKQEGKLLPVDTTVAAFSLLGMVMWLVRWYDPDGRLASEDLVRDLTEIAAAGMLRPEPAAASR
jgi:AcrR family transcriptional regulator